MLDRNVDSNESGRIWHYNKITCMTLCVMQARKFGSTGIDVAGLYVPGTG